MVVRLSAGQRVKPEPRNGGPPRQICRLRRGEGI